MAQGGDWGGLVTSWLGLDHAAHLAGIHLNMIGLRPTPATPQTDEERAWLARTQMAMQMEGAYFMQQSTKPQTLAAALMDSPVGTAAWILEKFHGWSDLGPAGDLDAIHSKDRLLTNIMLYLVTDSIATSLWYYRALFEENGGVALPEGRRVETPTALANFPGERLYTAPPRSWAERAYNIRRWTDMSGGGHFAAMERPAEFVADIRAFARDIGY
jgi:microsomal epoxide hydrolase